MTRPADLHKGSGVAVDNASARWYIAECKPTKERTIRTMLTNANYEVYVASKEEEVVYKSRNRRKKETIVIPGKVFVRTDQTRLMEILLGYSSVHRFMINRSTEARSYAYVPDDQMQQLQYMLGHAENPVLLTADHLPPLPRISAESMNACCQLYSSMPMCPRMATRLPASSEILSVDLA